MGYLSSSTGSRCVFMPQYKREGSCVQRRHGEALAGRNAALPPLTLARPQTQATRPVSGAHPSPRRPGAAPAALPSPFPERARHRRRHRRLLLPSAPLRRHNNGERGRGRGGLQFPECNAAARRWLFRPPSPVGPRAQPIRSEQVAR